jgi:hypothetical protein
MIALRMICAVLALITFAAAQERKPLSGDDLVQLKKAGFDEAMMIKALETNGAAIDTSASGLITLKNAGLSDQLIAAVLATSAKPLVAQSPGTPLASGTLKGIVLSGASNNPKHIQDVLDGLKDRFSEAKITVTVLEKSRTDLLEQIKASGGTLLWITVDIAVGQLKDKVKAQYYDASGTKLWEEEASGGMVNFSASGALKNMIKNIFSKIEPHIKGK